MKVSDKFVIREIAGEFIIVPTGEEALKFQGLITVNETGVFLWRALQKEGQTKESLCRALCEEYDTDDETATKDILEFLETLQEKNILIG